MPYFFRATVKCEHVFQMAAVLISHSEMLISRKYPNLPRTLLFRRPNPVYVSLPITPGISMIFSLGWVSPGEIISVIKADALYFYAVSFPSGISAFWTPLPSEILCPSLACMDIFWKYTILSIVSKPRASPML